VTGRARGSTLLISLVTVAACAGSPPSQPTASAVAGSLGPFATVDPASPYRTTRDEFMIRTKACIEAKGFPVTMDLADSSFLFNLGSDERAQQAKLALRECREEVDPARLQPPPPLSTEQLRQMYQYRLRQSDCLGEAGYDVPAAPPEQVYVDTEGYWDPFQALLDAGTPASQADTMRCQQLRDGRPAFMDW